MPEPEELAPARAPHPILTIKAAVQKARDGGLRVELLESFGVVCISQHARNRWEKDPRAKAINAIGAVILMKQPECSETDEAATAALDVPLAYVDGFTHGSLRLTPSKEWLESPQHRLYWGGYEAGLFYREWFLRTA